MPKRPKVKKPSRLVHRRPFAAVQDVLAGNLPIDRARALNAANREGKIMLCKDIMNSDVECVSTGSSVREAARKMRDRNVGFLPVCDEEMRPVGAVTDRDIAVRVVADGYKLTTPVDTIMSLEVIACRADDDLNRARELMAEHQKSRIMCTNNDGRLEGVISLSDIAQFDDVAGATILRHVSGREARSNPWRAANDREG